MVHVAADSRHSTRVYEAPCAVGGSAETYAKPLSRPGAAATRVGGASCKRPLDSPGTCRPRPADQVIDCLSGVKPPEGAPMGETPLETASWRAHRSSKSGPDSQLASKRRRWRSRRQPVSASRPNGLLMTNRTP